MFDDQDLIEYKQAQLALKASEARNRAILEAIPDLIFRVSREGICLDWKPAKEDTFLLQGREIIGKHLLECLPTAVAELIWHHVELALSSQEIQIVHYQLPHNGKIHNFEARLVQSGPHEVVTIVQDISERVQAQVILQQANEALENRVAERTAALKEANHILRAEIVDRKRAEQALRASEERFRQALIYAPFPIMIHAEDGEILQVNQVWTELTGYTHDEIPTIADWLTQAYDTDQHEKVRSQLQKLYSLNYRIDEGEFTITTKDGTNCIWHFSSAPLGKLPDGRRAAITMATDITARKQAEEGVRFLHSVTQAIFESQDFQAALGVAIQKVCEATGWDFGEAWVPSSDGSVLECSPAWFSKAKNLGRFRAESQMLTFSPGVGLPGRVWLSQQPEWQRDVSALGSQVYLRTRMASDVGLKAGLGIPLLTPDGVIAVLVFYMFESQDEDQRLIELISASTQLGLMIQRKQAEGDIRKALAREKELTELKTRFISMTSHEFRTPLTTIQSSAELLEHYSHKWTEEKKLIHLRRIQSSVKHMTKLLNDILIIGKVEAGKLQLTPVPLDLEAFCHNLVEELQLNDAEQHVIHFRVESSGWEHQNTETRGHTDTDTGEHPEGKSTPCMDEKLLWQILENLLSNALKYSPKGSTIEFTLHYADNQAIFQIRDQGIGIPLADQERLFDTFHRATNVGTIAGTGLGLAIVKKCVEIHNGQITVDSQIGVGTTLTVTLPMYNSLVSS